MKKTLFCLFLLVVVGCSKEKKSSPTVYFAGEIVNPTSEYVILYRDDLAIDSAKLDANNRFEITLDTIKEGLHNFKHAPEYQYVYLERGDSLVIRLNTSDFDESLVFSGKGEEVNNFLLEMFLTNEEEELLIASFYPLEPQQFSEKIDSLRAAKLTLLENITAEADLSENAVDMTHASIDYNYFIFKELYPFYHKRRKGEKTIPELSDDFYEYRNSLDLNNENLTYYRPYYKFINYHLGNLTYMQCFENCDLHDNKMSYLHFNRHKLGLIDSLITEKELRDNIFRHLAMDYLLKVQDNQENNKIFIDEFHKRSGNNRHIEEITNLYEGIKSIQPNKVLPDIMVHDVAGNSISLRDIARNKNVVFYFWSSTQKGHFDNIVKRIEELTLKNPEYSFVGINFNTEPMRWQGMIEAKGLDSNTQYRSDNFKQLTNSLVMHQLNKAVIAKDSLIVDAFANLYTSF